MTGRYNAYTGNRPLKWQISVPKSNFELLDHVDMLDHVDHVDQAVHMDIWGGLENGPHMVHMRSTYHFFNRGANMTVTFFNYIFCYYARTRQDTRMGQLAGARARAAMHFSLRRPHNMI